MRYILSYSFALGIGGYYTIDSANLDGTGRRGVACVRRLSDARDVLVAVVADRGGVVYDNHLAAPILHPDR